MIISDIITLALCETDARGFAQIAQLVEQWTENPRVAGSIPALGIFYARKGVTWSFGAIFLFQTMI